MTSHHCGGKKTTHCRRLIIGGGHSQRLIIDCWTRRLVFLSRGLLAKFGPTSGGQFRRLPFFVRHPFTRQCSTHSRFNSDSFVNLFVQSFLFTKFYTDSLVREKSPNFVRKKREKEESDQKRPIRRSFCFSLFVCESFCHDASLLNLHDVRAALLASHLFPIMTLPSV